MQKMNPLLLSLFSRFPLYLVVVVTAKVGTAFLLLSDGDSFVVFWSCCSAGTVCGCAGSLRWLCVNTHSFATGGLGTLGT